jgi:hypothetical protein
MEAVEDRTYVRRRLATTVPPATAPRKAQARSNLVTGKQISSIVADVPSRAGQRGHHHHKQFTYVISRSRAVLNRAPELFSCHVWRRRQVPMSQPFHTNILSALIFRKSVQIGHEDLQASFRRHTGIAIY